MKKILIICFLLTTAIAKAQYLNNPGSNHGNRFEQLSFLLADPNEYRTASGAPGPKYWQQRADYDISCELDEANLLLTGTETITYYNNAPDVLTYLWIQVDGNIHDPASDNLRSTQSRMQRQMSHQQIVNLQPWDKAKEQGLGVKLTKVVDATGNNLKYTMNQTMMRDRKSVV